MEGRLGRLVRMQPNEGRAELQTLKEREGIRGRGGEEEGRIAIRGVRERHG